MDSGDLASENESSSNASAQGFWITERGKLGGIKRKSLPPDPQEGLLIMNVFRDLIRSNLLDRYLDYQTSQLEAC